MRVHWIAFTAVALVVCGCGNSTSGSTITLTVANQMTACSWKLTVNGTSQTISAAATGTISVSAGSSLVVSTSAAAGDCTIASSSSVNSYSTVSANGTCTLASTSSVTAMTLTLEPASGYTASSNVASDTKLACP